MRQKLFLPDEIKIDQCSSQREISSWNENLFLTENSHALLFSGLPSISSTVLQNFYRSQAKKLHLVDQNDRISISSILSAIERSRSAFLENDDLAFIASNGWPLKLLRKHRSSLHPVKHLLLMQMLNTQVSDLCDAVQSPHVLDSTSSKLISKPSTKSPQEKELRRERFLTSLLTSILCRKAPDYTWLYRHDREWLKETLLARRKKNNSRRILRIDWGSRDILLALQVQAIAQRHIQNNNSPRRTATYLARQTGKGSTIEKFSEKLPMTTAALQENSESLSAFQSRRVERVMIQLEQAGLPLTRWQILKQSGLREPLNMAVEETINVYLEHAHNL